MSKTNAGKQQPNGAAAATADQDTAVAERPATTSEEVTTTTADAAVTTTAAPSAAELAAENEQLQGLLREANARNTALQANKGNKLPMGVLAGKSFQVHGSCQWKKKQYSPEMIAKNEDGVLAHLVKTSLGDLVTAA